MVLGPLSLMLIPPAGSPEFCCTKAPETFPAMAWSTWVAPLLVKSSDFTEDMAFPRDLLLAPVPVPVTTTSSRLRRSSARTIS